MTVMFGMLLIKTVFSYFQVLKLNTQVMMNL